MAQENNQQNQGTTPNKVDSNAENINRSGGNVTNQSTLTAQSTQNQTMGNQSQPMGNTAAAVKKYDTTEKSGEGSASGTIKEFYDKAKQSAGQVTEKATEKLDEKKTVVTEGLSGVADSIRRVGENLRETGSKGEENPIAQFTGKYGDALANQVEQISEYFDRKNVREIVRDVEGFARKNPAVFIGGAFALGILAARFLKSSSPKQLTKAHGRDFDKSYSGDADYTNGESKAVANPS